MDEHELRKRLLDADAALSADGLAQVSIDSAAIRARARRQSMRRRAMGGTMASVIGIAAIVGWWQRELVESRSDSALAEQPVLSPVEIEVLKHEIAALDAEALRAQTLVDRLRHADRLAAIGDESTVVPITTMDSTPGEQIDRAAGIGVISADFLANDLHRATDAAESYRSVLKHFPDSRWAAVARERLSQIDMMN